MDAKYVGLLSTVQDTAAKVALAEIIKDLEKLKVIVKSQKSA